VTVLHAPGRNADAVADYAVAFALGPPADPHFVETTGRGEWDLAFDPAGLPAGRDEPHRRDRRLR